MTHTVRTWLALVSLLLVFLLPHGVRASQTDGTIDATLKYAWSNNAGWINFGAGSGNLHVTDTSLTGYAWSGNYGWIYMTPTNGGVTNNGEGDLGGFAWGAALGWIDFSGVSIDGTGNFHGTATGSIVGTLTFDCANCTVSTDWRPVSVRTPPPPPPPGGGGGGGGGAFVPALPSTGNIPASGQEAGARDGDIIKDGVIEILDYNTLMLNWGLRGNNPADINHDGVVDVLDFNLIMIYWGVHYAL